MEELTLRRNLLSATNSAKQTSWIQLMKELFKHQYAISTLSEQDQGTYGTSYQHLNTIKKFSSLYNLAYSNMQHLINI